MDSRTIEREEKRRPLNIDPETKTKLKYVRIVYTCTHYGEIPKSRGKGIRKAVRYKATKCKATFTLNYNKTLRCLVVNTAEACWEHEGHPLTEEAHKKEPKHLRLTGKEVSQLKEWVSFEPKNRILQSLVNKTFSKSFSLGQMRRLKCWIKTKGDMGQEEPEKVFDVLEEIDADGVDTGVHLTHDPDTGVHLTHDPDTGVNHPFCSRTVDFTEEQREEEDIERKRNADEEEEEGEEEEESAKMELDFSQITTSEKQQQQQQQQQQQSHQQQQQSQQYQEKATHLKRGSDQLQNSSAQTKKSKLYDHEHFDDSSASAYHRLGPTTDSDTDSAEEFTPKVESDLFSVFGQTVELNLRQMPRVQAIHAQKLIHDILYMGNLGDLSILSSVSSGRKFAPNIQSVEHVGDVSTSSSVSPERSILPSNNQNPPKQDQNFATNILKNIAGTITHHGYRLIAPSPDHLLIHKNNENKDSCACLPVPMPVRSPSVSNPTLEPSNSSNLILPKSEPC